MPPPATPVPADAFAATSAPRRRRSRLLRLALRAPRPGAAGHTRSLVLHEQALQLAVLDHLREIHTRHMHLRLGFSSLFDYTIIGVYL